MGSAPGPIRMDLDGNPLGPTEHVASTLAAGASGRDEEALATALREEVAIFAGVSARSIRLVQRIDELAAAWIARAGAEAPVIVFPPGGERIAIADSRRRVVVHRGPGFQPDIDPETASELPTGAIAVLMSPHDPSGALTPAQDVVRLARACDLVIVDQRHGGYSPRTLVPLAREFDNVVILDTLETWGGLDAFPVGWAIGSPATLDRLGGVGTVPSGSLLAGLAVFEDLANVRAAIRAVRDERSRMYRMLRKLNLVQPLPSWANFMLVRVTRGDRDAIVSGLASRGILVHVPDGPGLERFIRISAGRPDDTDALRRALVEIAVGIA